MPLEAVQTGFEPTGGLPGQLTSTYNGAPTSYVARTDYNALGKVSQYVLHTGLFSGTGKRVYWSFTHELETGRLTGTRTDRETGSPSTLVDAR
jgi:hypothetical protein